MGSSDGEAIAAPAPAQNGGSRSECRQTAGEVVPSERYGSSSSSSSSSRSSCCRREYQADGRRERVLDSVALIGQGSDALVYLVRSKLTGRMSALKVQRKAQHEKSVERVHMERQVLVDARHPLVAPLYTAFQDRLYLYLEMEYCPGGSLDNFLRYFVKRNLTEDEARFYAAEITLGLEFLHSKGYVYRDLKAANVLVAASGHIKLTDFGIAERGKLRIETDDKMWKEEEEASPPRPLPRIQSSPGFAKAAAPGETQRQSLGAHPERAGGAAAAGGAPPAAAPPSAGAVSFSSSHGHRTTSSTPGLNGTPPLPSPGCHRRASTSPCVASSPLSTGSSSCSGGGGGGGGGGNAPPHESSPSASAGARGGSYTSLFRRKQHRHGRQQQSQQPSPLVAGETPPRPPPRLGLGKRIRGRFSRGSRGSEQPAGSASDSPSPASSPEGTGPGGVLPTAPASGRCRGVLQRDGGQGQEIRPPSSTYRGYAKTRRATVTLGEASWGLLSGSPEYMAPEVLMHDPQGSAVDWWGLGILTYELLLGRTPFAGENGKTRFTFLNIMHKEAGFPGPGERGEGDISDTCQQFIRALLFKDPRGRAGSASPVREHPFLSGVAWERLLQDEPPLRAPGGGQQAPLPMVDNTAGWWWDPEDAIVAEEEEEAEAVAAGRPGGAEKTWWPFDRFDWSDGEGTGGLDASCDLGPACRSSEATVPS
eukprot:g8376.t1